MNYAVDYAPVEESVVYAWEGSEEPRRIVLTNPKPKGKTDRSSAFGMKMKKQSKKSRLTASMPVDDFLAQVGENDTIFTELGGQGELICLVANYRKAKIMRLPTVVIHDEQRRQREAGEEQKRLGQEVVKNEPDEPAFLLYKFAIEKTELFYAFREVDPTFLRIRLLERRYATVQRKIRMATANRFRHLQQDLKLLELVDPAHDESKLKLIRTINETIDLVVEDVPIAEQMERDWNEEGAISVGPKGEIEVGRLKFYKSFENRLVSLIEKELETLPLFQAVFAPLSPVPGIGPIVSGVLIGEVLDIRAFPTFPKFKAFAGYHLVKSNSHWEAPRRRRGQTANWNHTLKQAVFFFAEQVNKGKVATNPWKQQLERRYLREVEKLLQAARENGKDVPDGMTTENFLSMVQGLRDDAAAAGEIARLPEPYKGIPARARMRAKRWIGQKFLGYIWTEWRRLEGLSTPAVPLFPVEAQSVVGA